MSRYSLLPLMLLSLVSCSESAQPDVDLGNSGNSLTTNRSIDDAISIVNNFMASTQVQSRATSFKGISSTHVITNDVSRSAAGDTLLYALDFEDNSGFALVAASNNVEPIIAVFDSGSFVDTYDEQNVAFQDAYSNIKTYVQRKSVPKPPFDEKLPIIIIPAEYYDTIDVNNRTEPTVDVKWGAKWPENIFCTNDDAGCVPVAIAQLLSVYEKPTEITYTFPNKDINHEALDWSKLKKHVDSDDNRKYCFCQAGESGHYTIARLLRELGNRMHATYDSDGDTYVSGTNMENWLKPVIENLTGISPNSTGSSLTNLHIELSNNKGVSICYAIRIDNQEKGHAFIADGASNYVYKIIRRTYNPEFKTYDSTFLRNEECKLIHYNWGWGGVCNGWFNLDAVNPNVVEVYDNYEEFNYRPYEYNSHPVKYWYYKL